jgi:endonuclease G, mitochondrial
MTRFGKFPSLEAFLAAHEADRRAREQAADAGFSFAARVARRRKRRDIVELGCSIAEVKSNDTSGAKHIRLHVVVTDIIESDADVDRDVQRHLASGDPVFVAIRYGDRHSGIDGPIAGLVEGADLRLRGEWITAERAHAVGGERLSVLHFTHPPIGFVAVGDTIYG